MACIVHTFPSIDPKHISSQPCQQIVLQIVITEESRQTYLIEQA